MKNIYIFLLVLYFLILCININRIPLFVGDESAYSDSLMSIINGRYDANNHPLLAKTIWLFFIITFQSITGNYYPFIWRLGTLICSVGILIYFYKIAKLFFKNRLALVATFFLSIDPMFYSLSRIMQLDIPALFFGIASLYYFLTYQKNLQSKALYLSAFLGGLTLAAKMYAFVPVLTLPILTLFERKLILKAKSERFLIYFLFLTLGFSIGNILLLILKSGINPFFYALILIKSQLTVPYANSGYLTSPAWSWFLVPQIITLYRSFSATNLTSINEILAFQNPLSFIFTIPAFLLTIYLTVKEKLNRPLWISLIWTSLGIYLPWFFKLHMTYYYYVLPVIPMILLFIIRVFEKCKNRIWYYLFAIISLIIFVLYFPLLNGITIAERYDKAMFRYSLYTFPSQDRLFCKNCSPRD